MLKGNKKRSFKLRKRPLRKRPKIGINLRIIRIT